MSGQNVQDNGRGWRTFLQSFGTRSFHGIQSVCRDHAQDLDHLTVAIRHLAELALHTLDGRRKVPVLEGGAITECARFASKNRDIVQRVVDLPIAAEGAVVLAYDLGQTLDFMLSERRNLTAARRFFKRAIDTNGVPDRVVIDKSGANLAGLQAVNVILKFTGDGRTIEVRQVKFLNNILEQDHRFIKRITGPMMGFKAFHSAAATIAGIEAAHMIRKGQIPANGATAFQTFAELAA